MRRTLVATGFLALVLLVAVWLRSPHEPHPEAGPDAPGTDSGTDAAARAEGGAPEGYASFTTDVMATTVRVTVPSGSRAREAAEAVFDVFRTVDERMSEWKEGSPLTAVNRAAGGEPVEVPAGLYELLERGVEIGERTGGAFDVTWAALWGLWDFRAAEPRVPTDAEIAERVELVDFRRVELDPEAHTVRLPREGMAIGLGGIAKGYALERAAAVLEERGVGSFLVVAGGQVLARGGKRAAGEEAAWRVGIRDPRGSPDDLFALVALRDGSLSTSGDYERFFVVDGVRYHHVLDPRTGRPARGVRSATVVGADPVLADALSTALMVLGTEEALTVVEGLDGVEAVLVDDRGELFVTGGLRDRMEVFHAPARGGTDAGPPDRSGPE